MKSMNQVAQSPYTLQQKVYKLLYKAIPRKSYEYEGILWKLHAHFLCQRYSQVGPLLTFKALSIWPL